ncbi:AAA family ATPase [Kribbella sp. VKM Ac-2568]|uniref:AAA family ATPase n=1 Tax=Kribbella sp. VKM Ac-2568 TaxID=2512219 RepID=UPI001047187F|nr:AAA family ATPase [Kribbella sp. VKM Ac-2568]TCM41788.1 thymidylate kinase [Kribbella sp. VKM Ac-2568]
MAASGTPESKLIVLRGNSGSGKSSTARLLRERLGRRTAWVEQDQIRRILLWERDRPGSPNIGLIDASARYALDHGYDVIVEGILDAGRYGEMLRTLTVDHRGLTRHYYFDIPFEETLARHSTRELANVVGSEEMRSWYQELDVLSGIGEEVIDRYSTLEQTVERILADLGWKPGDTRELTD